MKRSGQIPVVVFVWLLLLLAPPACARRAPERPERPNIILILADDLGCETLGCYGGTSYRTPRLDALARGGLRFRHAYSMPVCHPTRICLLTGRYPFHLGHPGWGSFPREQEGNTFPHVMKRAGYATAIAGKWQLTLLKREPDHPRRLGFDEYCLFGWHEGPRYYQPLIWQNGQIRDDVRDRYGPDVYCDFLIDFMERHRERPFVAFYSMALCHDVTDDLDAPVPVGPLGRYQNYAEMVEAMDERVGRLLDAVDRLDLGRKTLILFTADNGTPKRSILTVENGKLVRVPVVSRRGETVIPGGKGDLTDGGTNVPLIASWPGIVPAGRVTDDLVDFSDFLPTLSALGGAKLPDGVDLDGHSFVPSLLGTGPPGRAWAFGEGGRRSWVRTQRWKLYRDGRFFDVERDPREEKPVDPATLTPSAAETRELLRSAMHRLLPES